MRFHKSNNKEKQQLNKLVQEELQFKDKGVKPKNKTPYKREKKNWTKQYEIDDEEGLWQNV